MKKLLVASCLLVLAVTGVHAAGSAPKGKGLITIKSKHGVSVTLDRLSKLLKKKGITVVLRWRHSARADGVGIRMRPTELLLFGKPQLGSHLMTSRQTAGIDLPLKALAWRDASGQVWLSYNDPAWIARRHGIRDRAKIIAKMSGALRKLTHKAAN